MTLEISRTVEESTQAAREVAAQIVNFSNEAAETGRRAAETRDGSAEIAGKVDELRATLVRVIRTSTADVDRRTSTRVDVDRQGTIEVAGKQLKVVISNLSEGGAMIAAALPGVGIDAPVALRIDGIALALNGVIARNDEGGALVKFKLTETAGKLVTDLISGRRAA